MRAHALLRFLLLLTVLTASNAAAQATINLTGPATTTYVAPANFDLQVSYSVSSGPKAEFIENTVITQNGVTISVIPQGTIPVRGLPPGRYEYMYRAIATRILPDGDMTHRPMSSGPVVITVNNPPEPIDAAAPGTISSVGPPVTGRPMTMSIQMVNTGETTWRAGSYFLDFVNGGDSYVWDFTPQGISHDVAPGQSYTFQFNITAKIFNTHGFNYYFQFQMRRNTVAFGLPTQVFSVYIINPINASQFDSQEVPTTMEVGKSYPVTIRMRNTGDYVWSASQAYSLGAQNPHDNTLWGTHRIQTADVPLGAIGEFKATVVAPAQPGVYNFQWRMVRDGVEWFGVLTPNVAITVSEPPPPPPPPLRGTTYTYDALGRLTGTSADSEQGPLVTAQIYLAGNRVQRSDARNNVTTTTYQAYSDPATDRETLIEEPESRITRIDRTPYGVITRIARDSRNGAPLQRHYVYDAHYRLCKSIEPETGATAVGLDAAGRILWTASGLALPSTSSCDQQAAAGSPRAITRSYDANGRLSAIVSPDGLGNQNIAYTPDGLINTISSSNGGGISAVSTFTYNSRRSLASETSSISNESDWTMSYTYDANGSLAGYTLPSGLHIDHHPDALGRSRAITDSAGRTVVSGVKRGATGTVAEFIYGNGIRHQRTLNERLLPSQVSDAGVMRLAYAYDKGGNVSSMMDLDGQSGLNRQMSYDGVDRILNVVSPEAGVNQSFSYDDFDNLTRLTTAGATPFNYYYDASNRLTNIRTDEGATIIGLAYDAQGNMINKNGRTFTFDANNRLIASAGSTTYAYDAAGRRVQRRAADGQDTNRYFYTRSGKLAVQFESKALRHTSHVYLDGIAVAAIETAQDGTASIKYVHNDILGSPIAYSSAQGTVIQRLQYTTFGMSTGVSDGKPGFTGHVEDADSGTVYMQQRYYDPQIALFLSPDPVPTFMNPVAMLNRYRYADSNPYRYHDPDGRCTGSHLANKDGTCMSTGEFTTMATTVNGGGNAARGATQTGGRARVGWPVGRNDPEWTRDPKLREETERAWEDSRPNAPEVRSGRPGSTKRENGGWVVLTIGERQPWLYRLPAGSRDRMSQESTIKPDPFLCGCTVLGFFHTHPNTRAEGYDPFGNPGDATFMQQMGVPGLIRSHEGYEFIPVRRGE
ncbi:RHS repeat-associated core domain-containing protein [Stenotrophomonas sp.]|uniref:RHS repeat domain-containing protein n=1 Tax=Stenotrophomonas sp. TaxID=69392 RepID=UPI0028ADCC2F|nr:RHS repeat-associated core domain-containing protein [Stenotrophomonas sp.]